MNISHSDALVFLGATGGSILVIRHMSDSIFKIIIPLSVSVLFAATSAAQSATPVAVVDDFLKAWNSHDANAFDRLFTEDAIWRQFITLAATGSVFFGYALCSFGSTMAAMA